MNELKPYEIPILKLEVKRYEYDFTGDDAFFAALEQSLIQKGRFQAHLTLDKAETMLHLTFRIRGVYELVCDRSLDPFEEPFETTQKLILKYGDRAEEVSDEIEIITWDTTSLNVARYLFEFISLTVPMKKLHPRFRQEEAEEGEDQEGKVVYTSKGDPKAEDETPAVDPRWEALNQLKNNGSRNGSH
ncbi:MAG: DUF177 domain-containing protein [Sphingobacteriaceae bacterium]|nr:DUF177 domain-containing protein [Cytophagaceae bacterium]